MRRIAVSKRLQNAAGWARIASPRASSCSAHAASTDVSRRLRSILYDECSRPGSAAIGPRSRTMAPLTLEFIGCGDAFASGGRFQTCFLVRGGDRPVLIDCGASAPVALQQRGVDITGIGLVVVSHLHGDHFGGLPFLLLDAAYNRPRTSPLVVAGPPGIRGACARHARHAVPGHARVGASHACRPISSSSSRGVRRRTRTCASRPSGCSTPRRRPAWLSGGDRVTR